MNPQLSRLSDTEKLLFQIEYHSTKRKKYLGILFALLLGGFGAHRFYLNQNTSGALYFLFSWTGVPFVIGWLESLLMSARVDRFNTELADNITTSIQNGRTLS